jgi:hypothetical protein
MQALLNTRMIAVILAICGCVAHPRGSALGEARAKAADATSDAPPPVGPAPYQQGIDEIVKALHRRDFKEASSAVERARRASPPVRPSADVLAYYDATVHAYQGDYRGAAKVMYEHIAKVGPTARAAFEFHDAMIALRAADGDLLSALVECEEMTKAGTLGTWTSPGSDRITLVRLKEYWHRAYLLRMIAQTLTGAERQAFIDYAESARQEYVSLAAPLAVLSDSIAVLDAYFAFCTGDPAKMREAALRVNVLEDNDVEDLYLVQLALEGAGDRETAAAVRKRIIMSSPTTVLTPVVLMWMRADEASVEQPRQFSPKHPNGVHPAQL